MFFIVFILGLFVGSFLNVLVDRIPKGESPIKGRSYCDKCKKTLVWYDLIPLISYMSLKGKCRHCKTSLSFYYPIVELATGVLFAAAVFFLGGITISVIYYLFLMSGFIVIFFADLKYGIIPDKIIFSSIVISLIYLFFIPFGSAQGEHNSLFLIHLFAAVGAGLFFLFLFLVTQGRGMGFGDVKFSFLMGLVLGFPNIVVGLYVAFLTGAIVGCILILWRKKRIFGTAIPFGPFLIIGSLTAIFFGEKILQIVYPLPFPL